MSAEQERVVSVIVNWAIKIIVALCSFIVATTFRDVKEEVKSIGNDVQAVKERLIRLDDKVDRNSSDIEKLELTKQNKKQ
jgi:hypothetical protein